MINRIQKGCEKMGRQMKDLTDILKNYTLEFFGKSKHKATPQDITEFPEVLLLDVRSREEFASLAGLANGTFP
jgi:hypothetical protein